MRILGITVPNEKRLEIGLTCVYGVGISSARKILDQVGIDYGKRAKDLTPDEENKIRTITTKNIENGLWSKHSNIQKIVNKMLDDLNIKYINIYVNISCISITFTHNTSSSTVVAPTTSPAQ